MIAPLYDDTATYDVGDIVTYESKLYKCITAIATPETFDDTKWEATTAVEEGSGGGGGSSVIPNPTGTPTDTLSTIGIDGAIYGIEGGGSISGEGVEIYSEDEYIVGKWIDGKKLYQRTYHFSTPITIPSSGWFTTNISNSDKDTYVEVIGVSPCKAVWNFLGATGDTGDYINILNVRDTAVECESLTIRYTKTVETPAPAWGGSVTNNYAGFIDTDNIIDSGTYTNTFSYTATEDCFINIAVVMSANDSATITIDGAVVTSGWCASLNTINSTLPLKKGQTLVATSSASNTSEYTVYGITYASGGSETPATDASEVEYDNATSQLSATNVQEAIDEVVANANTASEDILTLQNVQGYDEYDETQTYAVGDYAIYNNIVYECTTAVSTAEPFDSTKWTATSIEQIIDGVKGDISRLNSSKVSIVNMRLTLTRTENDYVDATSFARLSAFRKDNVLFFICNLSLSSSIPAGEHPDFVEIGRISDWSGLYTIMQNIPSQQSDGNSLLIRITQNGIISIYSVKATSSWYRAVVSIPATII
jgi:hypothetical protein